METTLKLGPRPFVFIGVIFAPIVIVVLYQLSRNGWRDALSVIGILCLLIAAIVSQLYFTKIKVDEEKIVIFGWFGEKSRVYFRDVSRTCVAVLFEPDYPVSISIYGKNRSKPAMVIKPKLLKKADIAWLLSLAALKVERREAPNHRAEPPSPSQGGSS